MRGWVRGVGSGASLFQWFHSGAWKGATLYFHSLLSVPTGSPFSSITAHHLQSNMCIRGTHNTVW